MSVCGKVLRDDIILFVLRCDATFLCVSFGVISPIDAIVFEDIELFEDFYVCLLVESKVSQIDGYLILYI